MGLMTVMVETTLNEKIEIHNVINLVRVSKEYLSVRVYDYGIFRFTHYNHTLEGEITSIKMDYQEDYIND